MSFPSLDLGGVRALLLERILHPKEVAEVTGGLDPDRQADRPVSMIEDEQFLLKPVAYRALVNDRPLVNPHRRWRAVPGTKKNRASKY